MRTRWNVLRAAGYGATAGALFSIIRTAVNTPGAPIEYYAGGIVGGILGGAVLFAVVALIRNAAARA